MDIKVLGSCCGSSGDTTLKLIEEVARAKGAVVRVQKLTDIQDIAAYGVMSTPGVVIDGKVVHVGSVPDRAAIEQWLAA
ncbi:thioredoxin family protein [Denitromonas sp.]|uniref:thioredoxin family protein n=1 Tax=Denitromonas sp. TaxID=2734609 RepID=UPI002AFE25DC|nr:thioredoxin family protein [Denitromonas sp.]